MACEERREGAVSAAAVEDGGSTGYASDGDAVFGYSSYDAYLKRQLERPFIRSSARSGPPAVGTASFWLGLARNDGREQSLLLRWRMVAPLVTPPPVTPCSVTPPTTPISNANLKDPLSEAPPDLDHPRLGPQEITIILLRKVGIIRCGAAVYALLVLLVLSTPSRISALSVTVNDVECIYEYVLYEDDTVSGNFVVVDHDIFWGSDHPDIDFILKSNIMAAVSVHQFAQCITCHDWSPDHSMIAFCPNNHEVHIYKLMGGKWEKIHVLHKHDQIVSGIDWGISSNRIVTVAHDKNSRVVRQEPAGDGSLPVELFEAIQICVNDKGKSGGSSEVVVAVAEAAEKSEQLVMESESDFDLEAQGNVAKLFSKTGSKKQSRRMKRKKRINAILEGNIADDVDYKLGDLKNPEAMQIEFTRRQGDKLIDCLGNMSATLNQLCDLVQICK
ncbi:hypothetical protein CASFOL_028408 [Castilleja foliolosa]|uniref:Uncharacterized protein n=1 Tax=Castilleja foliolosa TaxID=1961234 RepID=A0ABD3CB30_9LAMI